MLKEYGTYFWYRSSRDKRIEVALTYIYGIGPARAAKVLQTTGIDPDTRVRI